VVTQGRGQKSLTGWLLQGAAAGQHFDLQHIEELRGATRGGPSRHVHYEQEELFYFVEGSDEVLIGEKKLRLNPGDSVLPPRNVPHVWAYLGQKPGRMVFAFTPAARQSSFRLSWNAHAGHSPRAPAVLLPFSSCILKTVPGNTDRQLLTNFVLAFYLVRGPRCRGP